MGTDLKKQNVSADYDVAIVGGGIAGSCAAAILKNTNIKSVLIDPNENMPVDFRCEKFDHKQMAIVERLGISEKIYKATTPIENIWIARNGKLVNKMVYPHYGFSYERVINAVRDYLDKPRDMILGKVKSVEQCEGFQKLVLADSREVSARLVILSNGLNPGIRKQLGVTQTMLSKNHEMAIGFDVEPETEGQFEFDSFTYWPEKASDKMAYFTIFKSADVFRVNMFGYWQKNDPVLQELIQDPVQCLAKLMPSLEGMVGRFKPVSRVHIRPVDLYQNHPSQCEGIVFVGDAYATSCPGAGTGTTKAMNDVDILCNRYIPEWLGSGKFGQSEIETFYQDLEKIQSDEVSLNEAYFLRSITLDKSIVWGARRWMRFFYHLGKSKIANMPILGNPEKGRAA
jgi:2-polyprenyl-6-methoxyphenol hydroxylase-like FAD-dependent oxidoreductase